MKFDIIGLIRVRNESLILQDTLNHFSQFVDKIILYDDASTDDTKKIAKENPHVLKIIENKHWNSNQEFVQTKQRQILLDEAKKFQPKWLFYIDADERFEGNIKQFLKSSASKKIDAIRICLFDAYLTPDDKKPYSGGPLFNFRKYFGPEAREICMIFRNKRGVRFEGRAAREPRIKGKIITKFYCQHYGKALSVKHWEETCDYYSKYVKIYSKKWEARRGKAIHIKSDFNRHLYKWEDVKKNKVLIYRYSPRTMFDRIKRKLLKFLR